MSRVPYHELKARERIAAIADRFDEILPPPARVMSPYLPKLEIPVSFDDGLVIGRAMLGTQPAYLAAQVGQFVGGSVTVAVIGSDIGAYGGMGILSACCDYRVMTEHGRLGISGPIVIEKWMGKEAYDSSDRALVWKTSGGKTRYLLGDADRLVEDSTDSVKAGLIDVLASPRVPDLAYAEARHADLAGQEPNRTAEMLGLPVYFGHLLTCLQVARRSGHRLVTVATGKAIGGAFICYGMFADAIYAEKVVEGLDGELSFPSAGEVAWREWSRGEDPVLVKSLDAVRFVPRAELLAA